jgi:hypothetical protein
LGLAHVDSPPDANLQQTKQGDANNVALSMFVPPLTAPMQESELGAILYPSSC